MKGAVFSGKHILKVEEREVPEVGADDVLIKVKACGICGTDVHIFEGDQGAADCPVGTILGHEFSGEVAAVGSHVTNVKIGDRVCVDPNKLCGECYYCRNGIGHFCERMVGIGTTVDGGFAEYCMVPKSQVYPIADTTTYAEAAMAEPVACCLHGIDMCNISPASTVLVIGGGMIGLIMLQLAKLAGAHKIILIEPVAAKREMGQKLGAHITIDPFNQDVKEVLSGEKVVRINTVIECAGLPSTIEQAIDLAGKKSTVMMFGLTKPMDEIRIRPFEIFQKEIEIKASFINPYTQTRAIQLIDSKKIDVTSMICGLRPLSDLEKILSTPKLRQEGKYIIVFDSTI